MERAMEDKSCYNTFANQFVSAKEILKKFHCELLWIKFLSKWHTWNSNQMLLLYNHSMRTSIVLWDAKIPFRIFVAYKAHGSFMSFSSCFRLSVQPIFLGREGEFRSLWVQISGSSISFWSFYVERWVFYPCIFLAAKFSEEICCSGSGWFKKQEHISNKTVQSNFP